MRHKVLTYTSTDLCVLYADWCLSKDKCNGCTEEEYFVYEFFKKDIKERRKYICYGYRFRELCTCNDYGILHIVDTKNIFNKTFHEFICRAWMDLSTANKENVKEFLLKYGRCVVKPNSGSLGKGVKFFEAMSQEEAELLAKKYAGRRMVLEEAVVQHPSLAAFNNSSLNTVRVYTFKGVSGIPLIMGASVRFGRVGNSVDNFHSGGISAIIDVKTGIIISEGVDNSCNYYANHPDSLIQFRGFACPSWEQIMKLTLKAAELIQGLHHVGWDVAVNSNGVAELIEGNTSPDFDILQLPDGQGKMYLYEEVVNEFKEHYKESITEKGYLMHATANMNFNYTIKKSLVNEMMDRVYSYLENTGKRISIISSLPFQEIMQENWTKRRVSKTAI